MKTNTFLVFAAAFAAAIHPTNAQLIINGGFETPDTTTYVNIDPGQNTIAPWVAGLHSVEVVDGVDNGFVVIPAFEGAQFLDLNGVRRGRLTQAFATTPGSLYTLTFAYSNNFYADPSTTASATVRVLDGLGDRLNQTITHTGSVAGDLNWTVFTAQFTALQNMTSLEFTSLTDVDGYSGGIYLDGVQVTLTLRATLVLRGSVATLNWTGGVPPYRVQRGTDLSLGDWTDVLTNAVSPVTLTLERQAEFYRIVGQ
jgi:hypothetical protein